GKDGVCAWRAEVACAVAKKNRDDIAYIADSGQVKFAVVIEISSRETRLCCEARRHGAHRRKPAHTVAQQQRNARVSANGHIQLAIRIEVADQDLPRSTSGGVFGRGSETANVVAEQNRDAVVNRARNRQVESAIVIEVGGGDKTSLNFNRIIGARS